MVIRTDYHFNAQIINRGSGRDSTAAAAYRAGDRIDDERTGRIHDYRKKAHGVIEAEIIIPIDSNWSPSRAELWNTVEMKNIRKDSQTAREINIALPAELDDEERYILVKNYTKLICDKYKVAADIAIHAPRKDSKLSDGHNNNYHAHIMFTTDLIIDDGLGKKAREMNQKDELKFMREVWEKSVNNSLRQHEKKHGIKMGSLGVQSHESYEARGINRIPTIHEGIAARSIERKTGEKTQVAMENYRRRGENIQRKIEEVNRDRRRELLKMLGTVQAQLVRQQEADEASRRRVAELAMRDLQKAEKQAAQQQQALTRSKPENRSLEPVKQSAPIGAKVIEAGVAALIRKDDQGVDLNRKVSEIGNKILAVENQWRQEYITEQKPIIIERQQQRIEASNKAIQEFQEVQEREPGLLGGLLGGQSRKAWEEEKAEKHRIAKELWTKAGGRPGDENNAEMLRRLTPEYAEEMAGKGFEALEKVDREGFRKELERRVERQYPGILEEKKEVEAKIQSQQEAERVEKERELQQRRINRGRGGR